MEPKISLLNAEQLKTEEVRELYTMFQEKEGKVPKWVRAMAHCEDILLPFFKLFQAIMDDKPVESIIKWKVAYQVSDLNECQFCCHVSRMKLSSLGMNKEEVKDFDKMLEKADEKEKAAVQYAKEATLHAYKIEDKTFANLEKHFNEAEITEITSVIGLFNYINRFNDALNILPDFD